MRGCPVRQGQVSNANHGRETPLREAAIEPVHAVANIVIGFAGALIWIGALCVAGYFQSLNVQKTLRDYLD